MGNYLQKNDFSDKFKLIKSLKDEPDSYFISGKKVRVINNRDYVKHIQSLSGGWDESMTECFNQICTVVNVDHDKAINILTSSKQKWLFNRAALESLDSMENNKIQLESIVSIKKNFDIEKKTSDEFSSLTEIDSIIEQNKPDGQFRGDKKQISSMVKVFRVGDMLRVSSNEKLIQEKQQFCGGYSKMRMRDLIGKIVTVKHYSARCVKVEKEGKDYDLHPDILDYPVDKEIIQKKETVVSEKSTIYFSAIADNDEDKLYEVIDKDTLNMQNNSGKTPVNLACCLGKLEMVKLLVEFGADLNIPDNNGNLPVHNCANKGHDEIIDYILEKFPDQINKKTQNGLSLLNIAKQKNNRILEAFLLTKNIDSSSRISQSVTNSLEISLLYPPTTLMPSNDDESSLVFGKYPLSTISTSLLEPPRDGSEYDTIPVVSFPIGRSTMVNSQNLDMLNSPPVENECMICRDGHLNTAFVQCGHLACNVCADRIFRCHICQAEIEKKIFIYL